MSENVKVSIKNLYKVFGANPTEALQHVYDGLGKYRVAGAHEHVLDFNNINIDIPEKRVQVIMGLSGFEEIHPDPAPQPPDRSDRR